MKDSDKSPPTWPLEVVLHYANCEIGEEGWQQVVLGPFQRDFPPPPTRDTPTFGVRSAEMARSIVGEFRSALDRLTQLQSTEGDEARELLRDITERASLRVDGYRLDADSGRLEPNLSTESGKFRELLFAYLVICLSEIPYYCLCRCRECGVFFQERSRRRPHYCSPRCRSASTVREHRRKNPDHYRERQRELMKKRRNSRTPQ